MIRSGKSVLVVDDDEAIRRLIVRSLESHGYECLPAAGGEEALESLENTPPDLVLLDISMPDIGGYEILDRIRSDRRTRLIPVIMVSARTDKGEIARCLDRGADDFVTKPIHLEELRSRIRSQIRSREVHEKYREFFEYASDGQVIFTQDLAVADVNRRFVILTGYSYDGLRDSGEMLFLTDEGRKILREGVDALKPGDDPIRMDLPSRRADGRDRVFAASLDRLPGDRGELILSLRDVTETRRVQEELVRTKGFLENVIRSSVDAIVAADMKGRIILFNEGAEKISAYRADDVLGRMNIVDFYSPGVAKDIMKKLRSEHYGGTGKLETCHNTIISKDGEEIPINISASIIYEEGYEVASVGIFTDLRERIYIERKLQEAREQLLDAEKQGAVAELAGAAAHELNQPLTSIRACAEILLGNLAEDDPNRRRVDLIVNEADRMAAQVKKIGQITSYETKTYVGGTKILDIDRSMDSE